MTASGNGRRPAGKTRPGGSQDRPPRRRGPVSPVRETPAGRTPSPGAPARPPRVPQPRGARPPAKAPGAARSSGAQKPSATVAPRKPAAPQPPLSPEALLALYRPDISEALLGLSSPAYRYSQVFEHLLRRPLQPFAAATTLPADVRAALDGLGASTLTEMETRTAADGTTKFLLSSADGKRLETVLMRYRDRFTVCASSQVGCPVACLFCATGAMGFERNLTAAEMVDQVRTCSALGEKERRRVSNLVYMGMGEPLLNLQAVLDSIRVLTDSRGLGLSHRSVSVSTVGIPSGMVRLGRAQPQVNLALSLHAANDRTRALLVPDRFRHPIAEILAAAWEHFAITGRKLLIEYVLLRGVNDSVDDARALAGLLRGHVVAVNLLRWNVVPRGGSDSSFQPSVPAAVSAFREALLAAHIETVVRQSKGGSIQGACGQLAGRRQGPGQGGPAPTT